MSSELDSVESYPPWNFKWVIKGELAIMGYPKSKENIKYLEENGIVHLVSLSPEKQPPFEYFPFNFRWTPIDVLEFEPPTMDQIVAFINTCKVAFFNKEPLAVHCRLGRGRSGTMAACYLVNFYNARPERAVTTIRMLQPGAIETYSQEKMVWAYYDLVRSREEEQLLEEVEAFIGRLPRPKWDFKLRPRRILDDLD
ncbi:dual specificity protein phosphatase 23 isoform X1 [Halyomorpha halys]|uniref:dual specificity protein phosphatase 23 isoform X1 n=1 Tax=Halyomorpha halys TaxID=286706 RepID=UPI0006D5174E|nr:dual specificity protein phosphatase 23-like [Halyomorpha halys]